MKPATLPTSNLDTTTPLTFELQANIENALSLALFHIRRAGSQSDIHRATAKAIRAAALLKQVSKGGAA